MAQTYLAGLTTRDSLTFRLTRMLNANGINVVASADEATAILRIGQQNRGRRVLSVDRDGRVREYELFYALSFEVKGRGNALQIPSQRISLERVLSWDPNDVLGKTEEAELLRQDMERDMTLIMMYRLQGAGRATRGKGAGTGTAL